MKNIPLTRPFFGPEEFASVQKCLESGWVTQGPYVAEFERRMAKRHQVPYAIATTSCTAALHLAMLALGIGPGDEVIVPAYTWVTSANCIEYVGARPVFADIDLHTFNLDIESFKSKIALRTRAVVVVHLFGLPAPMDEILSIARRYNLYVIEDAACAIGSEYDNVPVGGLGDIGCFSFHPRKIVTTGEGGMMTTRCQTYADLAASFRNHGCEAHPDPGPGKMLKPYDMSSVIRIGYNLRLSDIQGAIGVAQMDRLDLLLAERKCWAERYTEALSACPDLILPHVPDKCLHTYQSYVVRLREGGKARRDRIMDRLASEGIWTRPGTHAVHRLQVYRERYGLREDQFPQACKGEDETITLPIFPGMSMHQQDYVVEKLVNLLK